MQCLHHILFQNTKGVNVITKTYKIPQIRLSYVSDVIAEKPQIKDSDSIAKVFRYTYEEGEIDYRESFKVAYLNRANKILGINTISTGGTTATVVVKKIIFSGALLSNACSIILCHNHPSGTLKPSLQDDNLTRQVVEAGKLLDIKVLDHVIVTSDGYYSYSDEGRII